MSGVYEPGFGVVSCCRRHTCVTGSHAADTNAPNNMLTHIKNGYGFRSVYISDTYTFLIHICFCSLCILLRRKVLACSTYLLASMTDHPCRDLLFMYMRCVPYNHSYWLCLSPTRSRPGIGADNLLYWQNIGTDIIIDSRNSLLI